MHILISVCTDIRFTKMLSNVKPFPVKGDFMNFGNGLSWKKMVYVTSRTTVSRLVSKLRFFWRAKFFQVVGKISEVNAFYCQSILQLLPLNLATLTMQSSFHFACQSRVFTSTYDVHCYLICCSFSQEVGKNEWNSD